MAANTAFWEARIAAVDLRIAAYEAAILAFATADASIKEYRYDTGQSSVRVERQEISELEATLDHMINQRQIYCIRAGQAKPGHNSRSSW